MMVKQGLKSKVCVFGLALWSCILSCTLCVSQEAKQGQEVEKLLKELNDDAWKVREGVMEQFVEL